MALSAGQSGAPVSSKACAHGSWVSFSNQRLISWPTRRESGLYSGFQADPCFFAMLQCTAGTLRRRRHSGSTWTVLQILFSLAPSRQCILFDVETWPAASISTGASTRCWPRLIVPGTVFLLTWHGSHVHPKVHKFSVAGYGWSLTLPCETALSSPLGRSPQWGGAQDTWPYMSSSSCWCLCHLVLGLSLNLGTWTSTCEWTLRGWGGLQCIVNATSCCLAGNHVVRMSHVFGWHNSFAACFCLYCDTVGFHHCVLGKSLVVFLVGLWPRWLFALLSFEW